MPKKLTWSQLLASEAVIICAIPFALTAAFQSFSQPDDNNTGYSWAVVGSIGATYAVRVAVTTGLYYVIPRRRARGLIVGAYIGTIVFECLLLLACLLAIFTKDPSPESWDALGFLFLVIILYGASLLGQILGMIVGALKGHD